jgi:hypothetical protein
LPESPEPDSEHEPEPDSEPEPESGEPDPTAVELARIHHFYGLLKLIVTVPLGIAAISLPILASYPALQVLAGKQTTLTITISFVFTVAVTVSLAGATIALVREMRRRGSVIKRQRARITRLEQERDALKAEIERLKGGGD